MIRRDFLKALTGGFAAAAVPAGTGESRDRSAGRACGPPQGEAGSSRILGRTGLRVPIVGMGAVNTMDPDLVRAALERGIRLFDTGHFYRRGRHEVMMGRVFKGIPRGSFLISTKVLGGDENQASAEFGPDADPREFIRRFETSLGRLGLEHADFLLLHGAGSRATALFEPYLEALVRMKKEGKARWIGVSTHINEPEVIRAAAAVGVHDVVMTAFNFRQPHREEVRAAIAEAAGAGLGIIAMKTQAGVFWDAGRKRPVDMKAALKWAIRDPNVHTAIPGFTTYEQLSEDVDVMNDPGLTAGEETALEAGVREGLAGLFCAQCGRCIGQCRAGLDIRSLMRGFMYGAGYGDAERASEVMETVRVSGSPCDGCVTCRVSCAMGLPVAARVTAALEYRRSAK